MKKIIIAFAATLMMCGFASQVKAENLSNEITIQVANDWDDLLDEYEEYVDQYIKTLKKAMEGDMSALSEYAALAEKAQKLANKIEKAKGEMSTSQLQRYAKITQKMASAAM